MTTTEDFLCALIDYTENIKPQIHRLLAESPLKAVRLRWADCRNKPRELLLERLKVENDPDVLRQLISDDFNKEELKILVERKRTDAIIESVLAEACYGNQEAMAKGLKFAKELDPAEYVQAMEKIAAEKVDEETFDYWEAETPTLGNLFIEELPLGALRNFLHPLFISDWEQHEEAVFTRLTEEEFKEARDCFAIATCGISFRKIKENSKANVIAYLEKDVELSDEDTEALEAFRWWAGIGEKPSNKFAQGIITNNTSPQDFSTGVNPGDPASKVTEMIEATKFESNAVVDLFIAWIREGQEGKVDHKTVAKWFELVDENNTRSLWFLEACDSISKLIPLLPDWLKSKPERIYARVKKLEDAKELSLKEMMFFYEKKDELLELLIEGTGGNMEMFYALAGNFEGTVRDFLEVGKELQSEN